MGIYLQTKPLPILGQLCVELLDLDILRLLRGKPHMKAIQVKQTGGAEALELVDLPVPQAKANEAVVKVAAAGVNFIDVYQREGRYKVPLPFVAGQEGAGVVTAVGAEVKSVKPGDRVAWTGIQGSYAEYIAAPADRLVQVPARRERARGRRHHAARHDCVLPDPRNFHAEAWRHGAGHAAAGGVGLLLVQMAHNIGARVIGTVSTEEKAKLAREARRRRNHSLYPGGF